jgi:hypothetical protein
LPYGEKGELMNTREMFEKWWQQFPRKIEKTEALREWGKLDIFDQQAALDAIPNHVRLWRIQGTPKEFIVYGRRWLARRRWEDELEIPPEMPQCDWNRNGSRDQTTGRCPEQAVKEHENQFYCAPHCARLGLKVVRG